MILICLNRRVYSSQRPLAVLKDFAVTKGPFSDSMAINVPVIVRKGRNTLSTLCGQLGDTKKFMQSLLDSFGAKMAKSDMERSVSLGVA